MLQSVTPAQARTLLDQGAVLVDIREADEHARERIAGARHVALSKLNGSVGETGGNAVVFHCKSGGRTAANAARLAGAAGGPAYVLDGGIEAWKAQGLPVVKDASQPIEIMRQVQITAGSLVLGGVILGALGSSWGYALSGFVGAGLVFAGVSGTCAMARMLGFMPWNRRVA